MDILQPDFMYIQNSGLFLVSSIQPGTMNGWYGYSGHAEGRNNPAMENVLDIGPLPRGWYQCGVHVDHTELGPDAVPLTAMPRLYAMNTYGRSGFFAHGDNYKHDASHGCLILPPKIRAMMTPGKILLVISAPPQEAPVVGQQTTGAGTSVAQP